MNHWWNCFTTHRLTIGAMNLYNSPHYLGIDCPLFSPSAEKKKKEAEKGDNPLKFISRAKEVHHVGRSVAAAARIIPPRIKCQLREWSTKNRMSLGWGYFHRVNRWKTGEKCFTDSLVKLLFEITNKIWENACEKLVNHQWNCFSAHQLTVSAVNSFNCPH